jgi:hypothetical protein
MFTILNINRFIKTHNKKDMLLSKSFKGANKIGLDFMCDKGHNYTMLWRHYKNGSGCPLCNKYKGEQEIIKILNKLNIKYEYQKSYDNLLGINNRKLSYDFYLPKFNLLIEYQGEQHERPVDFFGGIEEFNKQIEHDKRKKEYSIVNKINLLEIWYYDFKNIEEILEDCLNGQRLSKNQQYWLSRVQRKLMTLEMDKSL